MIYEINNKKYNIIFVKKNNKNIYLRIDDDLNILVTGNCSKKTIENMLITNIKKIDKMIENKSKEVNKKSKFYFLGKNYDIITISTFSKIQIIDDKIYINNLKGLNKWLKEQIINIYLKRLDYWYNTFEEKIPYPNLKYRNMKTRWGVCNRKTNTITLNTNLIRYDIECLDYVIIHELSHFVEFNHSKNFWNVVSKYCKNYKEIKRKLKE